MKLMELEHLDGGKIKTRCQSCEVEIILDPEGEPMAEGSLAEKFGLGLARTSMLCDECASKLEAAELRAATKKAQRARLAESKLPKPLRGLLFDEMIRTPGREEAIERAEEWSESGRGLVIYGPTGSGKTRLAATAAYKRLEREPIRWVSVAVLLAELGAAFSDVARREAVKVITGEHGLVLDDFDKVKPSEWARNQLFAAVDRRVQAGAPLLVTTNLRPRELKDKFGGPLASRLEGCRIVELKGPDYRTKLDV